MANEEQRPANKFRVVIEIVDDDHDPRKANITIQTIPNINALPMGQVPQTAALLTMMRMVKANSEQIGAAQKPKIKGRARKRGEKLKLPESRLLGPDGSPLA